jgi:hypothetical protein
LAKSPRRWKLALLCAVVLAFITSIPQIYIRYVRGTEWNGSCAFSDPDELPYAAYTNALIDGRLRRNDPYSGKDDSKFETLFSIQFLPAYAIALPARLLHLSADTAFILILPFATIVAFLVLWCLLFELTGNSPLAVVGAVCVISLSAAAGHSPLQILFRVETGYDPFPFLRRYIPALPFPVFLASTLFVWRALTRNLGWAVLAGVSFAILVYSYFFLWTAIAAWFFTIMVLWFIARPADRPKTLKVSGMLVGVGVIALAPFLWLLMQRPASMDQGQVLELRHAPDLFRAPELYGALVLGLLIFHVRRKLKTSKDPRILFAASFGLAPFLVFNQQIITGRSLQPFHYEEFAANYWVVIAAILALGILRQHIPKRIIAYLGLGGMGVAVVLAMFTIRIMESTNIRFDQVRSVGPSLDKESGRGVVFASDRFLTHSIPVISNKPVLWARYLYTFSNVDSAEQKQRYYQYLYYSGFDEDQFKRMLRDDFTSRWEVFGAERVNPILTSSHSPITEQDIINAGSEYEEFTRAFDSSLAMNPLLSYAVVSPNDNLSNLDRWYERSEGERTGEFVIYHLKPRIATSSLSLSTTRVRAYSVVQPKIGRIF